MNRLLIMILLTAGILGCQSREEKTASQEMNQTSDSTSAHQKETEKAKKEDDDDDELNNGAKWKLDEKTRENAAVLDRLLKDSASSPLLLKQLQQQTDKLVSDCRMEGKAHEALHEWLSEFLEHLEKTGKEKDKTQDLSVSRLKKDMESFYRVFE